MKLLMLIVLMLIVSVFMTTSAFALESVSFSTSSATCDPHKSCDTQVLYASGDEKPHPVQDPYALFAGQPHKPFNQLVASIKNDSVLRLEFPNAYSPTSETVVPVQLTLKYQGKSYAQGYLHIHVKGVKKNSTLHLDELQMKSPFSHASTPFQIKVRNDSGHAIKKFTLSITDQPDDGDAVVTDSEGNARPDAKKDTEEATQSLLSDAYTYVVYTPKASNKGGNTDHFGIEVADSYSKVKGTVDVTVKSFNEPNPWERFRYRGTIGGEFSQNKNNGNRFSQFRPYISLTGTTLWCSGFLDKYAWGDFGFGCAPYHNADPIYAPRFMTHFTVMLATDPAAYKDAYSQPKVTDFTSISVFPTLEYDIFNALNGPHANNRLFIGVISSAGVRSINDPSVTKSLRGFWNTGLRFGEHEIMKNQYHTPSTRSYLDITFGRYRHLVGEYSWAAEGFLELPSSDYGSLSVKAYFGHHAKDTSIVLRFTKVFDLQGFVENISGSIKAIATPEKSSEE